jgi:hypothetical protein
MAELRLIALSEKSLDGTTEQQLPRVSSPVGPYSEQVERLTSGHDRPSTEGRNKQNRSRTAQTLISRHGRGVGGASTSVQVGNRASEISSKNLSGIAGAIKHKKCIANAGTDLFFKDKNEWY